MPKEKTMEQSVAKKRDIQSLNSITKSICKQIVEGFLGEGSIWKIEMGDLVWDVFMRREVEVDKATKKKIEDKWSQIKIHQIKIV